MKGLQKGYSMMMSSEKLVETFTIENQKALKLTLEHGMSIVLYYTNGGTQELIIFVLDQWGYSGMMSKRFFLNKIKKIESKK